jgi:VWFA-related protein
MSARFLFAAFFLAVTAFGQNTIDLNVVVNGKSGPPVAGLAQEDFTLLDNKVPQTITSFRALDLSQPVHVILVVDAVNTPYMSVAYVRGKLDGYLHANGGQLASPTQVAFFTDSGLDLPDGFTTDGNELATTVAQHEVGLRTLRPSSQYEAIDRVGLSMQALRTLIARETALPGRKLVLWISPGWPLLSGQNLRVGKLQQQQIYGDVEPQPSRGTTTQQRMIYAAIVDLSTRMRAAQIVLYDPNPFGAGQDIATASYYKAFLKPVTRPIQALMGNLGLQVLALQSGGLTLTSSNDLTSMLRQCAADAQASYQIGYRPSGAEAKYHSLEIKLRQQELKARTRQGYYEK